MLVRPIQITKLIHWMETKVKNLLNDTNNENIKLKERVKLLEDSFQKKKIVPRRNKWFLKKNKNKYLNKKRNSMGGIQKYMIKRRH